MQSLPAWAEDLARTLLEDTLPRRWAHVQGVAARARSLAAAFPADKELLEAAAWLHDIGYLPELARTGMHGLDGACYLRDVQHANPMLCRLVAHHSCAIIEAEERGLADVLRREFEPPPAAARGRAHLLRHDHQPRRRACERRPAPSRNPPPLRGKPPSQPVNAPRDAYDPASRRPGPRESSQRPVKSPSAQVRSCTAVEEMTDAQPHRPIHRVAAKIILRHPPHLAALVTRCRRSTSSARGQENGELLPRLAVAGVQDHVLRIGIDPDQSRDRAVNAGLFLGLPDRPPAPSIPRDQSRRRAPPSSDCPSAG